MDFCFNGEVNPNYATDNCILFNEDCRKVLDNIKDESIDLFCSDIPYKISKKGGGQKKQGKKYAGGIFNCFENTEENINNIKNGKIFKHNDIDITEYIGEVYRILKEKSHCYLFSNWSNLNKIITETENVGFKLQNVIVWAKDNKVMNHYYMGQCEYILMFRKAGAKDINDMGTSNFLQIPNVKDKVHPTQKPVELMKILIENSSNVGDVVMDCFMGSGSTGVACIESGRKFIGCEIDGKYFDISVDKIKEVVE